MLLGKFLKFSQWQAKNRIGEECFKQIFKQKKKFSSLLSDKDQSNHKDAIIKFNPVLFYHKEGSGKKICGSGKQPGLVRGRHN